MTCRAIAVSVPGMALAVCECGYRERVEHGTRTQAQVLADEHNRLAVVLAESLPTRAVG